MPRLGVRAPLSPPACPCSSVRKERRRPKSRVGGSNPSRGTTQERSSVWPERRSPKPVVGGSNPPAPANSITNLPWPTCVQAPAHRRPQKAASSQLQISVRPEGNRRGPDIPEGPDFRVIGSDGGWSSHAFRHCGVGRNPGWSIAEFQSAPTSALGPGSPSISLRANRGMRRGDPSSPPGCPTSEVSWIAASAAMTGLSSSFPRKREPTQAHRAVAGECVDSRFRGSDDCGATGVTVVGAATLLVIAA